MQMLPADCKLLWSAKPEEGLTVKNFYGLYALKVTTTTGRAPLEGDVVVCLDTGELLGNIQHLNDKIFSQSAHAPFTNQSIGAALPPR